MKGVFKFRLKKEAGLASLQSIVFWVFVLSGLAFVLEWVDETVEERSNPTQIETPVSSYSYTGPRNYTSKH